MVAAAFALLVWLMAPIREIVVAVLLAGLLSVLLSPFVGMLRRKAHLGRTFSAVLGLLLGILIVGGLLSIAVNQLLRQLGNLAEDTVEGIETLITWINDGPLGSQSYRVEDLLGGLQDQILSLLRSNGSFLASEAWTIASSAVGLIAAGLIMLFCLFFFLRDGRSMWIWFVRMLPTSARVPAHEAGIRGWVTLGGYVRTQVQVAGIDALGIGIGAFALGLPLAVPITVLVFFGSFIPIFGAFISGSVAIFIALVNNGPTSAVIMFVIVLAVQQLEGHVLQPWMMSSAVSIHPVAVVLSVAVGTIVAGIPGALFAVPLVAFINVVMLYLHGHDSLPQLTLDENRPGGPPGSLHEQIEASYQRKGFVPVKDEVRESAAPEDPEAQEDGS